MKPTALITNDDGIQTAFLHALVEACEAEGFRVVVAAPTGERSWIGRAFSRHREVTVTPYPKFGTHAWAIDGTPSDCVNIALGHLLPHRPQVVISGLNIGFNATMPLCLSSGTLAGATEGSAWGIPAVAGSLDLEQSLFEQVRDNPTHCPADLKASLKSACHHTARFAQKLLQQDNGPLQVHSLNFPTGVTDDTTMERGTAALVHHKSLFQPQGDGYRFVWNDGENLSKNELQTDLAILERGMISHTVFDWSKSAVG
jgi:5'-nucleotidase